CSRPTWSPRRSAMPSGWWCSSVAGCFSMERLRRLPLRAATMTSSRPSWRSCVAGASCEGPFSLRCLWCPARARPSHGFGGSSMRWLLGKDLLILWRSRLLVALLVVYPVAIALLIGFAISASPSKPRVAVVDETPPGQTITLGEKRVSLDEYTNELFNQLDVVRVPTRAEAVSKVASGDVLAAIVIPADIVSKISSGVSQARAEVIYNGDALKQSFVRSAIDSALAQANLALSEQIKSVAVHDLNLLLSGGKIGPLGSQELIGLRQLPETLKSIAKRQPSGEDRATLT